MANVNEGQRKLVATGKSLAAIATVTGVSRPTVSRWKNAESIPKLKQRIAIESAFGIPRDDWDRPLGAGETIPNVAEAPRGRPRKDAERPASIVSPDDEPVDAQAPQGPQTAPQTPQRPAIPPYPAEPSDGASTLDWMRHEVRCMRHDLRHREYTAAAAGKVRADIARTLNAVAKLEANEELKEDKYIREHPGWKRLMNVLFGVLERHPEVAKEFKEAMELEYDF